MFRKNSMVHNYPCFKFYLPLFLGKPVHWNKEKAYISIKKLKERRFWETHVILLRFFRLSYVFIFSYYWQSL